MSPRTEPGATANQGRAVNWRLVALSIVAAGVALVTVANAHLVYVAVSSQPGCVAHVDDGKTFQAAKPAC